MKMKVRPQLFIDTKPLEEDDPQALKIFGETDKYSITPTTFKARSFSSHDASLRTEVVEETIKRVATEKHNLITRYKEFERYEQESQEQLKKLSRDIIPDGEFTKPNKDILVLGEKFIPKISSLEIYSKELEQYQSFIKKNQGLILTYSDKYANDSSEVIRFGINTATMNSGQSQQLATIYTPIEKKGGSVKSGGSKGAKDDQVLLKTLHPLEVFLIRNAIDCLKTLKNKSVLIDIFARNDDGSIIMKDEKPETHTIVLYMYTKKIIVIDPSNPDFSKHLTVNNIRLFRGDEEHIEIIAPLKQKIYTPANKDNIGPNPDQYRDCIDIALKIAFGLNQWHDPIDLNDITSFNFITEVSNQQDITNSLFFDGTEATVRIRQASNDIIRKQTNKLLDVFDQQIKGFRAYFSNIDLGTHIKELIIKAFNQAYDPNIYSEGISNLKLVYQENAMIFKNEIDKEINLLGEALEEV